MTFPKTSDSASTSTHAIVTSTFAVSFFNFFFHYYSWICFVAVKLQLPTSAHLAVIMIGVIIYFVSQFTVCVLLNFVLTPLKFQARGHCTPSRKKMEFAAQCRKFRLYLCQYTHKKNGFVNLLSIVKTVSGSRLFHFLQPLHEIKWSKFNKKLFFQWSVSWQAEQLNGIL